MKLSRSNNKFISILLASLTGCYLYISYSMYKHVTFSNTFDGMFCSQDGWMNGQNGMNVESSASNMDPK